MCETQQWRSEALQRLPVTLDRDDAAKPKATDGLLDTFHRAHDVDNRRRYQWVIVEIGLGKLQYSTYLHIDLCVDVLDECVERAFQSVAQHEAGCDEADAEHDSERG